MSTLKERQKAEALKRMRLIGLREDYIRDFEQNDRVHISTEDGSHVDMDEQCLNRIRRLERVICATVYLVVRTYRGGGVMDALFYVDDFEKGWATDRAFLKAGYDISYVVNYRNPDNTEFMEILFHKTPSGDIIRVL